MDRKSLVSSNVLRFRELVAPAKLLAVTKYSNIDDVFYAYDSGHRDFGESRVQNLKEKSDELNSSGRKNVRWHFIGHIQSNKLNRLLKIPGLKYIHSIDSYKILELLYDKIEHFEGETLYYFLEVKTSGENEKAGLEDYDELAKAMNFILNHETPKLKFAGLMTMGSIRSENFEESAKNSFKKLKEYRDRLHKEFEYPNLKLSMGMSSDYMFALEEGSDWVRVGSAIFPKI
ncbi:MAG: YggS family pyridoxal phosphate-dependent enzyme, partial [Bacteriovoracaceae bacterium]|nr:YggS family pyridoxal phosphate-dependent enzyme [Bacteriovoracaceae bacterium]